MSDKAWGATIKSREEKFELKRRALLNTAASLFRTKGVENTSLGDIAVELNISKPTVYYYFANKDQVLLALVETGIAEFLDRSKYPEDFPLVEGLSGADQLERFLRRALRILFFGELGGDAASWLARNFEGEQRVLFVAAQRPFDEMGETILQAGFDDGSLERSHIAMTYRFVIGVLRYIPLWLKDTDLAKEDVAEACVHFVMRSLRRAAP
ncbi:MAG: TetR/AcrR family transcriptional regulator [Rhizomicrobium sp.]